MEKSVAIDGENRRDVGGVLDWKRVLVIERLVRLGRDFSF